MASETTNNPASDMQLKQVTSLDGDEKADTVFVEDVPTYDTLQTKRLLRKIDWHLIPFLSLLYLLSFLDRTNIGNAKLFGLELAIGLKGKEYNTALSVFCKSRQPTIDIFQVLMRTFSRDICLV